MVLTWMTFYDKAFLNRTGEGKGDPLVTSWSWKEKKRLQMKYAFLK